MTSEHFHGLPCHFSPTLHTLQAHMGLSSCLKLGGQDLHPKHMPCSPEADFAELLSDKRCVLESPDRPQPPEPLDVLLWSEPVLSLCTTEMNLLASRPPAGQTFPGCLSWCLGRQTGLNLSDLTEL